MILQYFKKKENKYKIKSNYIYLDILTKSKLLIEEKYFSEINFSVTFELISIFLIYYFKFLNDESVISNKRVKEELMKNLINDLDKSLRDAGISDMSIGKYVKKYVKKFYYRLKVLDPIFEKNDNLQLVNYLNSLEFINKKYSNDLSIRLSEIFVVIKKNNQ